MNKTTKATAATNTAKATIGPTVTKEFERAEFMRAANRGSATIDAQIIEKFLHIMDFMASSKRSFGLSEVITNSKVFSLPVPQVKVLWEAWVAVQQRLCRGELIEGVMDEKTFCLH